MACGCGNGFQSPTRPEGAGASPAGPFLHPGAIFRTGAAAARARTADCLGRDDPSERGSEKRTGDSHPALGLPAGGSSCGATAAASARRLSMAHGYRDSRTPRGSAHSTGDTSTREGMRCNPQIPDREEAKRDEDERRIGQRNTMSTKTTGDKNHETHRGRETTMSTTDSTRRSAAPRGHVQAARTARDSGARASARHRRHHEGKGCPNPWHPHTDTNPPASVSPTWLFANWALSTSTVIPGGV